jgi:hypothetical protein
MAKEATVLRRAGVLAAGLAIAASVGPAGAGAASAATPSNHIASGAIWSFVVKGERSFCEQDTFSSSGTFTADKYRDSGIWSGGGGTIAMKWKTGESSPSTFTGTFTKTPVKEYKGTALFMGLTFSAKLVKGALAGC